MTNHQAGLLCPLCGGTGAYCTTHDGYRLRECWANSEGMVHGAVLLSWPWQSEGEYEAWYREGDEYHVKEAKAIDAGDFWHRDTEYLTANVRRLSFIKSSVEIPWQPRVIDVGCGTGSMVAMASALWEAAAAGLEPNRIMKDKARALGREVCEGGWTNAGGKWDLIFLCDVLEHLTRPAQCLEYLACNLADDGYLYIEMPEHDFSRGAITAKHIKPRQHICLYSMKAAETLYAECGLVPVAMQRPLGGTLGKMAHILRRA